MFSAVEVCTEVAAPAASTPAHGCDADALYVARTRSAWCSPAAEDVCRSHVTALKLGLGAGVTLLLDGLPSFARAQTPLIRRPIPDSGR
jgi:hypothetical protein